MIFFCDKLVIITAFSYIKVDAYNKAVYTNYLMYVNVFRKRLNVNEC